MQRAIEALSEAGFLGSIECNGRTCYRLEPSLEHWDTLEQLVRHYEDPLRRDTIYDLLHQADLERQFRMSMAVAREWVFTG